MAQVNKSRYLDGAVPGRLAARSRSTEERIYAQPQMAAGDVGEAAEVQDGRSLCERVAGEDGEAPGWLSRNKNTLIAAGLIYGGYRILRR